MRFEVDPQPEARPPFPEGYDWALCSTNYRPTAALRKPSAPAPTMAFGHEQPRWLAVGVDGQVIHRVEGDESSRPVTAGTTKAPDSIRVTPHEAGVLQSFPGDYPWQGSKSGRYLQVGNAVPPLLVEATLRAVVP